MSTENPDSFEALLARSSLGTPEAVAFRALGREELAKLSRCEERHPMGSTRCTYPAGHAGLHGLDGPIQDPS